MLYHTKHRKYRLQKAQVHGEHVVTTSDRSGDGTAALELAITATTDTVEGIRVDRKEVETSDDCCTSFGMMKLLCFSKSVRRGNRDMGMTGENLNVLLPPPYEFSQFVLSAKNIPPPLGFQEEGGGSANNISVVVTNNATHYKPKETFATTDFVMSPKRSIFRVDEQDDCEECEMSDEECTIHNQVFVSPTHPGRNGDIHRVESRNDVTVGRSDGKQNELDSVCDNNNNVIINDNSHSGNFKNSNNGTLKNINIIKNDNYSNSSCLNNNIKSVLTIHTPAKPPTKFNSLQQSMATSPTKFNNNQQQSPTNNQQQSTVQQQSPSTRKTKHKVAGCNIKSHALVRSLQQQNEELVNRGGLAACSDQETSRRKRTHKHQEKQRVCCYSDVGEEQSPYQEYSTSLVNSFGRRIEREELCCSSGTSNARSSCEEERMRKPQHQKESGYQSRDTYTDSSCTSPHSTDHEDVFLPSSKRVMQRRRTKPNKTTMRGYNGEGEGRQSNGKPSRQCTRFDTTRQTGSTSNDDGGEKLGLLVSPGVVENGKDSGTLLAASRRTSHDNEMCMTSVL